jgi:SAM-dependent methyltransferase
MGPVLHRDPLIPPRRLQRYARGDFAETGETLLAQLRELAGLEPGDRVLDVGCGTGRLARPLVGFLDGGSYEGFDVDREAIGWCRRAYRRHRNARFLRADLFHPRLHPGGAHLAAEYRFPYGDGEFGLVAAVSVLTHLLEADAGRYLSECMRVLAPGGRLFATCFVLDEASRAAIARGDATFAFLDPAEHVAVVSEDLPEEAVAYDRAWIAGRVQGDVEVHPGSWRGGEAGPDLLDVVVVRRA